MNKNKKILFVISEDWYFVSHRFHIATKAIDEGYSVALLSNLNNHRHQIEQAGIIVIDWGLNRKTKNIFGEVIAIKSIMLFIYRFKPSVIYAVAMKPVIYSAIASIISGLKNRVYAFAGLGFIFSSKRKSAKILRPILKLILKFLLKGINTRLILQNRDDAFDILNSKLISKKNIKLIRGSGVDTTNYSFSTIPNDVPLVILPARMLWDKGIGEFVESAIILKRKGFNARFVLVGTPDEHNPESINETQLEIWKNEEIIEWWGHQNNMVKVYHQSTIVCLPSYREGLPKSLLEAASCGRPIVAYDVPGCREIVKDGYNGYLVQPKSIDGLVEAIILLINNYKLCVQMGKNGRKLVEKHFTQEKIARETIAVWEEVLAC